MTFLTEFLKVSRRETELYTAYIANSITTQLKQQARPQIGVSHASRTVRILDLCTGTGCIPLLLYSILSKHIPRLHILGVDISPTAVALAKTNLQHNVILSHLPPTASEQIRFVQEDVFSEMQMAPGKWDLVISNPPYISPRCFDRDTSRSVRNYEPKAALVPLETHAASAEDAYSSRGDTAIGDAFYPKILEIASRTEAKAMVVEVADLDQAERVAGLVVRSGRWSGCEIWRDWLDTTAEAETFIDGMAVKVKGEGSGRSVFACRSSRDHILHNTSNS